MTQQPTWQVHHKRAEGFLTELPDNSVDLILTDPPYYKVKDEPWDRQWDSPAAFLSWIGALCDEWKRILKPNGSLYVCASPQMAARVEVKIGDTFNVLTRITWRKEAGWAKRTCKEDLRQFFPSSETIVFAEQFGADNPNSDGEWARLCEPLLQYLDSERQAAGINFECVRQIVGCAPGSGLPSHWFTRSQWTLPTAQNYAKLQDATGRFSRPYTALQMELELLNTEYAAIRRPFSVTADVPYTDVWDFAPVQAYPGKHECEKPQELLRHIISASSRPGAVVLDTFMGGGSTGEAALTLGRSFIGCDASKHWADYSRNRLANVAPGEATEAPRPTMAKVIPIKKRETAPSRPEQVRFSFDMAEGMVSP